MPSRHFTFNNFQRLYTRKWLENKLGIQNSFLQYFLQIVSKGIKTWYKIELQMIHGGEAKELQIMSTEAQKKMINYPHVTISQRNIEYQGTMV